MYVTLYLYIVNMHVTLLQRTSFAEFNENKLYKLDENKLEKPYFRCIYEKKFTKILAVVSGK